MYIIRSKSEYPTGYITGFAYLYVSLKCQQIMYQSIPSLIILLGKPRGIFWQGEFPTPGHKESANPDPWGRKIVLKPHPRGNYFQKSSKKPTEHEKEIMKNWNAVMFRNIVKHITAQSFLVEWMAFMDIQNISNHSPFIYINQHKKFMTSKYQNTILVNNNC